MLILFIRTTNFDYYHLLNSDQQNLFLGVNRYFSRYSLSDISKYRCLSSGVYLFIYLHNDTSGT